MHLPRRQRNRNQRSQCGDGSFERPGKNIDLFARVTCVPCKALITCALHACFPNTQTRHQISRPGTVLRRQRPEHSLDGDGCGRGPKHSCYLESPRPLAFSSRWRWAACCRSRFSSQWPPLRIGASVLPLTSLTLTQFLIGR
jgi:hypothetical protein